MKNDVIQRQNQGSLASERLPIDTVLDGFLSTKRSENTKRAYSRDISDLLDYLNIHYLDQIGNVMFHNLVRKINQHLEEVTKVDEQTKRPLNAKTVNRKAYAISSFFKYLMHVYEYPKNPLDQFQAHKIERHSTTKSLSRAEVLDVISYLAEKRRLSQTAFRDYMAICCLAILALRRNELVGLKWSDLDIDNSSINVFQKGGSYKLLPIPTVLLKTLVEYRDLYEPSCAYIFSPVRNNATKSVKKPLNTSYIYRLVKKTVSRVANGKHATPHSFRKAFIEMALNNQEDFISIINATGHTTVEMVKYYDTRDSLKNNAVHGMSKLM